MAKKSPAAKKWIPTHKQIQEFHDALMWNDLKGLKPRHGKEVKTISPLLLRWLTELYGLHDSPLKGHEAIRRALAEAVGTQQVLSQVHTAMIVDWLVRGYLPYRLDQLGMPEADGDALQELQPVLWFNTDVDAIGKLNTMCIRYEPLMKSGAATDNARYQSAKESVLRAMGLLGILLGDTMDYGLIHDRRLPYRLYAAVKGADGKALDFLRSTLPSLVKMMKETSQRDSFHYVARRCTWTEIANPSPKGKGKVA